MRVILVIILFVLGILAALAVGGGLLALMAYGVGWVVNQIMHLEPFQATILALAGIVAFGILAARIWEAIISAPTMLRNRDEFDEDDEDDEDDEEDEAEEPPVIITNPRLPRWRQPLKNVDFSNTQPDERCPCGSGRKYKNCHGAKQPK
jgi:type VI protein secretion system component VasK